MPLNLRNIGVALALIAAIFILYTLLAPVEHIAPADIDSSLTQGQLYLKSAYNEDYLYEDSYIHCSPPCDPRYKKIDGAIDLIWIGDEVKEHSIIDYQINYADEFLKNQTILLETESVFNGQGVFIGDQHCILASMYNDTKIIGKIDELAQPYGWENKSIFNEEDLYQKISYESWCIMLLAERGSNRSKAVVMAEEGLNETFEIIQNPRVSLISKTYAALHSLIIFKKLDELGYNTGSYKQQTSFLQDFLAGALEDSSLVGDTNVQSIVLITLCDYRYKADETKKIALRLLHRQSADGSWEMWINKKSDYGRAFTTLHAILALNKYRIVYLGG